MTTSPLHQEIEDRFLDLVQDAGLPAPDDTARLSKALIFLWYESKAFVLVDLDELPAGESPLEGLDLDALRDDVLPASREARAAPASPARRRPCAPPRGGSRG